MTPIALGNTGIEINRLGLGCWAIGGPCMDGGAQMGWGDVDDEASIRAIRAALDVGVNYIDTANIYGAGHSEEVVGRAIKGVREKVVLSTKFGIRCDPAHKRTAGIIERAEEVHESCEASLKRLGTDYIDLFLFHLGSCEPAFAHEVLNALEGLVSAGKIRAYGWSTEKPELAAIFAGGGHCGAFMHIENLFEDYPDMLAVSASAGVASVCRSPLCMGLLTGKYGAGTRFAGNDLRGLNAPAWMNYFIGGQPNPELLRRLDAVREILTEGGRTLAQGCLAWIWARGGNTVPVPGFRNERQAVDNARAMEKGPLTPAQMRAIGDAMALTARE